VVIVGDMERRKEKKGKRKEVKLGPN